MAKRATGYARDMAEAIHYAHPQAIPHRDLKPSNELIGPTDQVKIADFGLAKVLTSETELTLSGQVLGTPNYLLPASSSTRVGRWAPVPMGT